MSERLTLEELFDKVAWEGGVADAIDYGIKHDEVPEVLEKLWREAEGVYRDFRDLVDKINDILDEVER